jgi:ferredoxin-NADP reductase
VTALVDETPRVRSIALDLPGRERHRPGQHVDVRLTAPDGYQTQRSYSIGSAPEDEQLLLTVERLDDGEVSPYLTEVLQGGDGVELRGPIGGWFVWDESLGGPLLLVAGGSGIVPFRAMLRHHRAVESTVPVRLIFSARTLEDVIYREELVRLSEANEIELVVTLTREQRDGWRHGRIDRTLLEEVSWAPAESPHVYVCGPTAFVEAAAEALVGLGHDPSRIRTERFGGK